MRSFLRLLLLGLGLMLAGPAFAACDVTATVADDLGSDSPNALKAGAPPYTGVPGGFGCSSASILTLLNGNYLRATVAAGSTLALTSTTTSDVVTYDLAATSSGSPPLVPGTATYYVNGTTLSLLANGTTTVPVYARPSAGGTIAAGTYRGSVQIRWDWYFCSAIGALNACVGTLDQGSKTATVTFTLTVVPRQATMAVTSATTWDTVSGTTVPKAIPGSRRRATLTIANPDIVPLDADTLAVVLPVAKGTIVALDGDGSGSTVVQTADGNPPSGLTVSYVSPSSTTDDVDFSSDGGVTWTYVPTAGDTVSEAAVTQVRIRPRGSMAAGSSFAVSLPFLVR